MRKTILYILLLLGSVVVLTRAGLLGGDHMILFHDETQGARVQEFTYNLRSFVLPPRLAPHFSFAMGYPVFNFYAPFSYWITAGLSLLGFDTADSIKLSFFLALVVGAFGMTLFLKRKFSSYAAFVGGLFYISSPWIASEIFVRGNLGEMWFAALLPYMFYLLERNSEERSTKVFILTSILVSFIFTSHNVLSYVLLPMVIVYIFLLRHRKRNFAAVTVGFLLSSYFIIPAVIESQMTYAREVAARTKYEDHFLCLWQLWTTNIWGFGGSAKGCYEDGMSFMIGKTQILLGLSGIAFYVFKGFSKILRRGTLLAHSSRRDFIEVYFICLLAVAVIMSVYLSKPIWDILSPIISVFQFPWRFLIFGIFVLSYFSGYLTDRLKINPLKFLVFFILVYTLFHNSQYFAGKTIEKSKYKNAYLSDHYVKSAAARKIPEYVPRSADMASWSLLDPTSPTFISVFDKTPTEIIGDYEYYKSGKTNTREFRLNVLYFPYWRILVNGKEYDPQEFDFLGRPIIKTNSNNNTVVVVYRETNLEMVSNALSLLGIVVLCLLLTRGSKSVFYRLLF